MPDQPQNPEDRGVSKRLIGLFQYTVMQLLPITFVVFLTMYGSSDSKAATEIWECSFTPTSGSAKGIPSTGRAVIDGDILNWQLPPPVKPYPGMRWTSFPNQLLQNNEVGVVAVSSSSRVYDRRNSLYRFITRPVIGASVIVINKLNGDLRSGSVMATGQYDLLTGHCVRRAADIPPAHQ